MGKYQYRLKIGAAFLAMLLLAGCVSQSALLVYTREEEATPAPVLSREPEKLVIPEITGPDVQTDGMGVPVLDASAHYYKLYLSVRDMRVYEEDGWTYLDAVVENAYGKTLRGGLDIVFYYEDGGLAGRGTLHTAEGWLALQPGATRVYAEILSETDVRLSDYSFMVTAPFLPAGA